MVLTSATIQAQAAAKVEEARQKLIDSGITPGEGVGINLTDQAQRSDEIVEGGPTILEQSLIGRAASASATSGTQAIAGKRPITSTPSTLTQQQKIEAAAKTGGRTFFNSGTGELTEKSTSGPGFTKPRSAAQIQDIVNLQKENDKLRRETVTQKAQITGFRDDVRGFREQLGVTQEQISASKEQYLSQLGEFAKQVDTQLRSVETEVGELDFSDTALQDALKTAQEQNATPMVVNTLLREHALRQRQELAQELVTPPVTEISEKPGEKTVSPKVNEVASPTDIALKDTGIAPTSKEVAVVEVPEIPEVKIIDYLNDTSDLGFDNLKSLMGDLVIDKDLSKVSSAEMNQLLLTQLSLEAADDSYKNQLSVFKTMEKRARDSFLAVEDDTDAATVEIDRIISGRDTKATTIEALNVKIAKQNQQSM